MTGEQSGPVLVVEDDPDTREALTEILQEEGYQVSAASQGEEALARLRGPVPPRVVILDLMMPVMDGFEFRVRQMEDPEIAGIPVIVLSCGEDLQRKAAALGMVVCLPKPVDVTRLLEVVGSCVKAPASRSAVR
jgi:two-component system chemotaxis response regulator CheY